MNSLKNKKTLITGGASGIGRAITKEMSELGADIIIHYHSSHEEAQSLMNEINKKGGKCHIFKADLTKEDEAVKTAEFIKEKFGNLDILINNTGDMVKRVDFLDMTSEYIKKVIAVNLESMIFLTKYIIPLMKNNKEGASIVNLASLAGRNGGSKGALAYSTCKGAIITLTKSLSNEFLPYGIRVNAVAPGLILGSRFHEVNTSKEAQEAIIKNIALKRAGTCEEVARAVAYLASEYNGFISGAILDINGGVY